MCCITGCVWKKYYNPEASKTLIKPVAKKEPILEYSTQISILPLPGTGTIGLLCEQGSAVGLAIV